MIQLTNRIFRRLTLLTLFAFLFAACKKENVAPDAVVPDAKKISRIEYDNGNYQSIEYDAGGNVSKITNHIESTGGTSYNNVYQFVYSGSFLLERVANDGSKYRYTYNGKDVIRTDLYNAAGNLVAYYMYTYKDGRLATGDGYFRVTGGSISVTPSMRYENEYHPAGNLKKVSFFYPSQTGPLEKVNEVVIDQYDDKRNTWLFFENNPILPLEKPVVNNPLSETYYDDKGKVEQTVTYTYTYDTDGRPLTRKKLTRMAGYPDITENTKFNY